MAALAFEPSGQSAQIIMMFQNQDFVSQFGQFVSSGQARQATADNDGIVS